jgi:hypothetical protein
MLAPSEAELAALMTKSESVEKLAAALALPGEVTDAIRRAADGRWDLQC